MKRVKRSKPGKPVINDLEKLTEDERIELIGRNATQGHIIGVLLEAKLPDKIIRYIEKLKSRFSETKLYATVKDKPCLGIMTLKFGPKDESKIINPNQVKGN